MVLPSAHINGKEAVHIARGRKHSKPPRHTGKLPRKLRVYLDSPMAISATEIFKRHQECFDDATWQVLMSGRAPFALPGLRFTQGSAESMALKQEKGAVIIAGSGMATGGRILHHLRNHLWKSETAVVFVGFAARGTLARAIIDGAEEVKIAGEEIAVNANIHTIGGFSAHADQKELLAWRRQTGAKRTFLVHGEEGAMRDFANLLKDTEVMTPDLHSAHKL